MGGLPKKIVTWGVIAFVIFLVAFRPGLAADFVQTLGAVVADMMAGVGKFFGDLVGGTLN